MLVAVEAALRRFKKKNDRKEREKGADFFFDFKVFGGVVLYNENEKSGKKKKKAKAFARYSSTFDFDKKVGVLSIRGGVFSFFFCRRARARLDCFLTKAGGKEKKKEKKKSNETLKGALSLSKGSPLIHHHHHLFRVLLLRSGLDLGLRGLGLDGRAHLARAPLLAPAAARRLGRRRRRLCPRAAAALAPAPRGAPARPPAGDVRLLDVPVAPVDGRDAGNVGGVASGDELGVGGGGGGGEERDCLFLVWFGFGVGGENEKKRGGG